jgi:hypothetical protein
MEATAASIVLALAACQPASLAPTASIGSADPSARAADSQRAHLYVSVATKSHYPSIERFRLANGIPAAKPDRVYSGFGGLIAVAGDGTLYVVTSSNVIDVFGSHDSTPARQIIVPSLTRRCHLISGGSSVVDGVAADANGYLFVAFLTYAGVKAKATRASPDFHWPCAGIVVYAPDASGKAQPMQAIRQDATPIGVAVDGSDDAYVADSEPAPLVDEFVNAILHPHKMRVFQSGYIGYVHAVATGRNGDLFIASTDSSYKSASIERYATDANGSGAPTSTISLPAGVQLLPAIAARERVLYVDNNYSSVDLYEADKNGSQSPFYSLPLSNVSSVAVGP